MKTMNYSLIRILFALVIGLVLVIWPNAAASYIVITVGVAFLIPGVIGLFGYFGWKRQILNLKQLLGCLMSCYSMMCQ